MSTQENQRLKDVSQEFESLLLALLFKTMRQTVLKSDLLGKGRDREWYTGLLDLELAQSFAHAGGLGLAKYILQDLQRLEAAKTAQPAGSPKSGGPENGEPAGSVPAPPTGNLGLAAPARLASGYGLRSDPFSGASTFHHGLDIASPVGTEIRAVRPGTVIFSGWKAGYGLTVLLSHADGYTSQYSHTSRNLVRVGEPVSEGQPIALVGQTGRTTGPHLHFEMHKAGSSVDPTTFLSPRAPV